MSMNGKTGYDEAALRDAHRHTIRNRGEIEHSQICHCICCRTYFRPSEIDSYTDGGETVICPYCDCDAVIGDGSGVALSDDLLQQMHERYF